MIIDDRLSAAERARRLVDERCNARREATRRGEKHDPAELVAHLLVTEYIRERVDLPVGSPIDCPDCEKYALQPLVEPDMAWLICPGCGWHVTYDHPERLDPVIVCIARAGRA